MSKLTPSLRTGEPLAVLHRAGGRWRGLHAEARDGGVRVLGTKDFGPAAATGAVDDWLETTGAARVLVVLPADSVVCRTARLPDAPPEQLEQALSLQAESHLLGSVPPHRQGHAVLPGPAGEERSGLLLAWPERAEEPTPPTAREATFVPDVACLAALVGSERTSPSNPEPSVFADRSDGSIAIALPIPGRVSFRATCESGETPEAWRSSVRRVLAETAMTAGLKPDVAVGPAAAAETELRDRPGNAALLLPGPVRAAAARRIEGSRDDARWWDEFGIAAGAALAAAGSLAPLAELRPEAADDDATGLAKMVETLSRPRTAARLAAAALLVLAFSPLLFAGARRALLEAKVGDVETAIARAASTESRKILYAELRNRAWPMTKLLSEVASTAPVGVVLESVAIDANKGLTVRGQGTSEQLVEMVKQLDATGVFANIVPNYEERDAAAGGPHFEITAEITNAYARARNLPDFAERTLFERLYGPFEEEAEVTTTEPVDDPPVDEAARQAGGEPPRIETRVPDGETTARSDEDAADAGPGAAGPRVLDAQGRPARTGPRERQPIRIPSSLADRDGEPSEEDRLPEPLTEETVRGMSYSEATAAFARVARAIMRSDVTPEEEKRLRQEQAWLQEQLARARAEDDGGGAP